MWLVRVKHRLGYSYLGFHNDGKPFLGCKRLAERFKTEKSAESASLFCQEGLNPYFHFYSEVVEGT